MPQDLHTRRLGACWKVLSPVPVPESSPNFRTDIPHGRLPSLLSFIQQVQEIRLLPTDPNTLPIFLPQRNGPRQNGAMVILRVATIRRQFEIWPVHVFGGPGQSRC